MANEVGNSELVTTWAFTGTKTEPDPSKFDQGWFLGERPPFEYMNWLQNDFGKKLNQLLTFGGAEWNATTEYPPGAMVTDGGSTWQSQTTNTNSPPTAVNVNWAIVLTSAVTSGALLIANNLSDLNDATIARSNLGLGGVAVLNNVPIASGGTGATSASGARSNLGLGNVATENIVPITKGGTGSTTASTARTALGLGSAAVKDLTDNNDLSVNPNDVGTRGNMAAAIAAAVGAIPTPANPVKAWVNFNGNGVISIRDSLNVSSITDNGTGDYTVNFATPLANANYAVSGCSSGLDSNINAENNIIGLYPNQLLTASGFRIRNRAVNTNYDSLTTTIIVTGS